MKLILDNENKYKDLLLKHLREHNVKFTGEKKFGEKCIYVIDNDTLLGAMKIGLGWDMVVINSVWYENDKVLESLLYEAHRIYADDSCNMMIKLFEEERIRDFEKLGFYELGRIIGTNKVLDDISFISKSNNFNKRHNVISGAGIDQFNKLLKEKETNYKRQNNILDNGNEIGFAAFEGETYLGGVIGIFKEDQMYIDLLTTTEEARGKGVGSALMNELEKYAKEQGVINIHVGTTDFQARPFYEKLGYEVRITFTDYPKGYNCYELQKMI